MTKEIQNPKSKIRMPHWQLGRQGQWAYASAGFINPDLSQERSRNLLPRDVAAWEFGFGHSFVICHLAFVILLSFGIRHLSFIRCASSFSICGIRVDE